MTTTVLTSAGAAAAYDDEGDTEWSHVLEKEISNLVTFDPLIIINNAQSESSQEEEEEEEEEEEDKDIFDFFHSFYLNAAQFESELQLEEEEEEEKEVFDLYKFDPITNITSQGHWLDISDVRITDRITYSDDKLRQPLMDAFNFVVDSNHDHADHQFYNILSDDQYASLGNIDSYDIDFSGFRIVTRDTFDKSQLDSALGRSWIMDDSIRVLRRVCREIQDDDAFFEFLINHVTEVRRVNQQISRNEIPGGGDDHSYLRTNKYEIMLHAAVLRHLKTLRADGELESVDGGEWTNELAVFFFLVLEEINNMLLDTSTELEILLELIYAEIEIN